MIKLLLNILLLISLVAFIILLSLFIPGNGKDPSYFASIIDKHKRLQNIPSPRIILIGGSGLAFGIKSKWIQQDLGLPVINMGVHAGFGLMYNMSEIKPYIGKNDIIVIIPEYENFLGTSFNGDEESAYNFMNFPENRKYTHSFKQYSAVLRHISHALRSRLFNLVTGNRFVCTPDYNRKSFNQYGDSEAHLNKPSHFSGQAVGYEMNGEINKDVIPELNNFNDYVEKRGARAFFIYPALMDVQYIKNKKKIEMISDALTRELKIPILSTPLDFVFPQTFFYDTVYHLTGAGRMLRTQKVIQKLNSVRNQIFDGRRKVN